MKVRDVSRRYKNIAEFGNKDRTEGPKSLDPDWSYNIGEAVLDIDAVVLSSFEVAILVLGENNLYCLKDNCVSLKYAKRFDYKPLCFQAYVIGMIDHDIRGKEKKKRQIVSDASPLLSRSLSSFPLFFERRKQSCVS